MDNANKLYVPNTVFEINEQPVIENISKIHNKKSEFDEDQDVPQIQKRIKTEFNDRIKQLKKQIQNIELRQQDLQKYITHIDHGIRTLDTIINQEESKTSNPDLSKISKCRAAISKNIELSIKVYDSYKEYENVKFRYYKEIDDSTHNTNKLLYLDITRIQEKDKSMDDDFFAVMSAMKKLMTTPDNSSTNDVATHPSNPVTQSRKELLTDSKYSL